MLLKFRNRLKALCPQEQMAGGKCAILLEKTGHRFGFISETCYIVQIY